MIELGQMDELDVREAARIAEEYPQEEELSERLNDLADRIGAAISEMRSVPKGAENICAVCYHRIDEENPAPQAEPLGFTWEDVDALRWVIAKKRASYPIAPGINASAILRQADDAVARIVALLLPRKGER